MHLLFGFHLHQSGTFFKAIFLGSPSSVFCSLRMSTIVPARSLYFELTPGQILRLREEMHAILSRKIRCHNVVVSSCGGDVFGVLVMKSDIDFIYYPIVIRCYNCIGHLDKSQAVFINIDEFRDDSFWEYLETLCLLTV